MTLSIYALNLAIGLSLGLAIDYSLLIISRYREEMAKAGPGGRGHRRDPAHRRQERALQRGHRGRGARGPDGLPAALPVLDGHRGRHGRPDRGGDRAARAAGGAGAARHPHQLAGPEGVAPAQRARRRGAHLGLLVPALERRHAPPGPDRGRDGARPDHRRPARVRHQVHLGRRERPARPAPPRARSRTPSATTSPRTAASRTSWPSPPRTPRRPRGRAGRLRGTSSGSCRAPPGSPRRSSRARTPGGSTSTATRPACRRPRAGPGGARSATPRPRSRRTSAASRRASWTRRPASRRTCRGRSWLIASTTIIALFVMTGSVDPAGQGRDHEPADPRLDARDPGVRSSRTAAWRGCSTTTASAPST